MRQEKLQQKPAQLIYTDFSESLLREKPLEMLLLKVKVQVLVTQSCPTLWDPMDTLQAPLSMGFSRQAYWSGLPLPSPGDKTRKYVRFSLRDVDCTPVQPWSGTLHALSSLMSLFDMLVFSKEDLLPCKTGDASLFPLCDHGSWLLPVPMATVHTSSQDRLILFLSVEEDCLKQGHFIYKINCNIG